MKRVLMVTCTMLLVASAGFAATPSVASLSSEALALILGDAGPCATQPSAVPAAVKPVLFGEKALCSATAHCASGTVSCISNINPANCSAVDRNCPERGHVTCDGVTTWCPTVCSQCDTCDATGDCIACCRCDGGGPVSCRRQCDPFP